MVVIKITKCFLIPQVRCVAAALKSNFCVLKSQTLLEQLKQISAIWTLDLPDTVGSLVQAQLLTGTQGTTVTLVAILTVTVSELDCI